MSNGNVLHPDRAGKNLQLNGRVREVRELSDWRLEPPDSYYAGEDEPAEVNLWEDLEYESYRDSNL